MDICKNCFIRLCAIQLYARYNAWLHTFIVNLLSSEACKKIQPNKFYTSRSKGHLTTVRNVSLKSRIFSYPLTLFETYFWEPVFICFFAKVNNVWSQCTDGAGTSCEQLLPPMLTRAYLQINTRTPLPVPRIRSKLYTHTRAPTTYNYFINGHSTSDTVKDTSHTTRAREISPNAREFCYVYSHSYLNQQIYVKLYNSRLPHFSLPLFSPHRCQYSLGHAFLHMFSYIVQFNYIKTPFAWCKNTQVRRRQHFHIVNVSWRHRANYETRQTPTTWWGGVGCALLTPYTQNII